MVQVHRVIEFNQEARLQPYIDMNIDLKRNKKTNLKRFFKFMNNANFGKTLKNVRKHRDIKLVTTKRRRTYLLLSELKRLKFKSLLQSFWQKIYEQ